MKQESKTKALVRRNLMKIDQVAYKKEWDLKNANAKKSKSRNSSMKTKSKKAKTKSEKAEDKKKAKHDSIPSYSASGPDDKHFIAACSSSYCSMLNGKSTWNLGKVT